MLQLAIACLVIALIAAVLGFGGIAGSFVGVAKILFVVFLVLAVLSFLFGGGLTLGTLMFETGVARAMADGARNTARADFAVASPEMVLAAIASRTTRIRLGSAVTVLSSDDPIRVFQRFSTLDAICRVLDCQPGDLLAYHPD